MLGVAERSLNVLDPPPQHPEAPAATQLNPCHQTHPLVWAPWAHQPPFLLLTHSPVAQPDAAILSSSVKTLARLNQKCFLLACFIQEWSVQEETCLNDVPADNNNSQWILSKQDRHKIPMVCVAIVAPVSTPIRLRKNGFRNII